MNKLVIVLNEQGLYEAAYADSEVEVEVLKRGCDDAKIDKAESSMEMVETE